MKLTKEIREILEDIVWWDTCPIEYKSKINAYLKSEKDSALNIDLVVGSDDVECETEKCYLFEKCKNHLKNEYCDDSMPMIQYCFKK